MQIADSDRTTDWSREGPRTLIVKDGAVWMWPGIPLAMKQDGIVQPLPRHWVRSWITALHGFEAQLSQFEPALIRASTYLTAGDEEQAQQALDAAKVTRLSPEGAVLMRVVADELGISKLGLGIGTRSAPWGVGNLGLQVALFRRFGGAAFEFEKGNADQPRWPKGSPEGQGGRYAPKDSGGGLGGEPPESSPSIGHNGGPPLDDPPEIPEEEPPTVALRNALIKNLAGWALRRGIVALIPGVGEVAAIVQLGVWIYEYLPYVNAYLQDPKTLEELNNDAMEPKEGYDIHHIVEQTPGRDEGFSNEQIESRENRVRISTLKHWEINGWYSRPNSDYGGLSPRDYLRGKSWDVRVQVGRQALIDAGVLMP